MAHKLNKRSRGWCFTFNNYSDIDYCNLVSSFEANSCMEYYVIGKEVGESGTPHLQGYIYLKNARSGNSIRNDFSKRIHWEERKGTHLQAAEYCKKDGDFREWGTAPKGQGARTDLVQMTSRVSEGKSNKEILEEFGDRALRTIGNLDKARAILLTKKRDWIMDVRIYYGAPGSGKTRAVWEEFGVDNVYPKMPGKWWDHYSGQECVLIDDFDPDNCFDSTYDFYLKLLDRYPLMIEWRNGSGWFCSKTIIFTSNFHPDDWFPKRFNKTAFFRRVSLIKEFLPVDNTQHSTEVGEGNTSVIDTPPPQINVCDADLPSWTGIMPTRG